MADPDPILATLVERLRDLPDEHFRLSLKEKLMEAAAATNATSHLPEGFRSVTPYLIIPRASNLIDFLVTAFGAEEKMRVPTPGGSLMHAEVRIGDSIVELADGSEAYPTMPTALHLYVPDADDVYERAMKAGAKSLSEPGDREYGDREASIEDPSGNYWYIATHKLRAGSFVPEGLHSVTPFLHPKGAAGQIQFMVEGLGAEEVGRHASPDGRVLHAKVRLIDSVIELGEAHDQWQPMPASIHFHVANCDEVYAQAIAAGGKSIYAPVDQPYGERSGGVLDPFGNKWWIATRLPPKG